MIITQVLGVRRVLIISPFLAICVGTVICSKPNTFLTFDKWLKYTLVLCYSIVVVGSVIQLFSRSNWLSYRWLDPFDEVVMSVQEKYPEALILTNSHSVFFYLDDNICPMSPTAKSGILPTDEIEYQNYKAYIFDTQSSKFVPQRPPDRVLKQRLQSSQSVVFIHSAARGPFSRIQPLIEDFLKKWGYVPNQIYSFLKVDPHFVNYHSSYSGQDTERALNLKRIVVEYFSRSSNNDSVSVKSPVDIPFK